MNLPTLTLKHNYDFRIRMKLDCLFNGNWSNWTTVQSWGNNTGKVTLSVKVQIFRMHVILTNFVSFLHIMSFCVDCMAPLINKRNTNTKS